MTLLLFISQSKRIAIDRGRLSQSARVLNILVVLFIRAAGCGEQKRGRNAACTIVGISRRRTDGSSQSLSYKNCMSLSLSVSQYYGYGRVFTYQRSALLLRMFHASHQLPLGIRGNADVRDLSVQVCRGSELSLSDADDSRTLLL